MAFAFTVAPDTREKVDLLGHAAQYDVCGEACGTQASRRRDNLDRWIYPAVLPDGKRIALLKVLLTNACENNCAYCVNHVGVHTFRQTNWPSSLTRWRSASSCRDCFSARGSVAGHSERWIV
jgi:predicted DNA-binding helix-hairpin-helix protein